MKLNPKLATFCPGCNHKNLELKTAPNLILQEEKKEPAKIVTLINRKIKNPRSGLF